jgi:hypothetical protein
VTDASVPAPEGTVRIYIDVVLDGDTDSGDVADGISDAIANRVGRGGFDVAQIAVADVATPSTEARDAAWEDQRSMMFRASLSAPSEGRNSNPHRAVVLGPALTAPSEVRDA